MMLYYIPANVQSARIKIHKVKKLFIIILTLFTKIPFLHEIMHKDATQNDTASKNEKFPSCEERPFTGGGVPEPAGNVRPFAALICTDKLLCYRTWKAKRLRIQTF